MGQQPLGCPRCPVWPSSRAQSAIPLTAGSRTNGLAADRCPQSVMERPSKLRPRRTATAAKQPRCPPAASGRQPKFKPRHFPHLRFVREAGRGDKPSPTFAPASSSRKGPAAHGADRSAPPSRNMASAHAASPVDPLACGSVHRATLISARPTERRLSTASNAVSNSGSSWQTEDVGRISPAWACAKSTAIASRSGAA